MKTPPPPLHQATPRGFTLVEVMVAMVIGMIGMIIMLQVFSAAEGQRRSTTGTGDSQSGGALATYALQRDIRQAGFGFNALNALGCTLTLPAPASRTLTQLAPVVINPPTADVPAGDANSDTLLITYGSGDGSPEGDVVTAAMGNQLGVQTASAFRTGDRVVAGPSVPTVGCALTLATVAAAVAPPNLTVPASGAVDGSTLFNLGANPRILAYAVRAGNLTVCDYLAANCGAACTATDGTCSANWVPIVNNIVALRAQYGHASTATSGVDTWDQATPQQPSPPNQDTLACSWARTSAVRIVVVARNSQPEQSNRHQTRQFVCTPPNAVRPDCVVDAPDWMGSTGAPINLGPPSSPAPASPPGWTLYRYRTFETVIPIRNLPWMATC